MRVLFLGDIVGKPGRQLVESQAAALRREFGLALLLANGENASGGLGLAPEEAGSLLRAGVDVLTSGNHIWKYKEIGAFLEEEPRLLRPANFPPGAPGAGIGLYELPAGGRYAVLNLQGRTFMQDLDCPFRKADELLAAVPPDVRIRFVDFHAEATSEKIALARYLDGRVSAVLGTHTHVQTNDARLLHKGTAAMTDAGMCGVHDSILGMDEKPILQRFLQGLPTRFTLAKGQAQLRGALMELDPETGRALAIEPFCRDTFDSN